MIKRPRRLRSTANVRALVRETHLNKSGLVYPIFVVEGEGIKREISSLKDCYHYSVDMLDDEIKELKEKISNAIPEVVYITVENENAAPAEVFINTEEQEPIKEKIVNITGKPFRE